MVLESSFLRGGQAAIGGMPAAMSLLGYVHVRRLEAEAGLLRKSSK